MARGAFIEIQITADSPQYVSWQQPVRAFFRRTGDGWKLVGLERLPDRLPAADAAAPQRADGSSR
jgi:hypothetical protein